MSKKRSKKQSTRKYSDKTTISNGNGDHKSAITEPVAPIISVEDGWYRLILFSPFFVGTFLASGFLLSRIDLFTIALTMLASGYYCGRKFSTINQDSIQNNSAPKHKGINLILAMLYVAQIILCFFCFYTTQNVLGTFLLLCTSFLLAFSEALTITRPFHLLLKMGLIILCASMLSVLGVFCQTIDIRLQISILGFTIGCILASYIVAKHTDIIINAGWKKSYLAKDKKGKEVIRPGSASRLYVLSLMLGPAITSMLASTGFIPQLYFLLAAVLLPTPKLANNFLTNSQTNEALAKQTLKLAGICAAAIIAIGLL